MGSLVEAIEEDIIVLLNQSEITWIFHQKFVSLLLLIVATAWPTEFRTGWLLTIIAFVVFQALAPPPPDSTIRIQ